MPNRTQITLNANDFESIGLRNQCRGTLTATLEAWRRIVAHLRLGIDCKEGSAGTPIHVRMNRSDKPKNIRLYQKIDRTEGQVKVLLKDQHVLADAIEQKLPLEFALLSWNIGTKHYDAETPCRQTFPWNQINDHINYSRHNSAHIYCLQEVFVKSSEERVGIDSFSKFEKLYYSFTTPTEGREYIMVSMVKRSLFDVKDPSIPIFCPEQRERPIALKVVLTSKSEPFVTFALFNIHLRAFTGKNDQEDKSTSACRQKQIAEIIGKIENGIPNILCGDFNLIAEKIQSRPNLEDGFPKLCVASNKNATYAKICRKENHCDLEQAKCYDYIGHYKSPHVTFRDTKVSTLPNWGDDRTYFHLPIRTTISF
jgi:endonuclease/exonuclease/phosphatase family metal-dependent hydrolase